MLVDGSCHCGRVTYRAEVDPADVSVCHCTDCQVLSGGPFRVSVRAPRERFELSGEAPSTYVKTADSGARRRQAFCGHCGAPIYACADVDEPPSYSLRVGGILQRALLPPKRRIWCRSALAWSQDLGALPGVERG